MLLISAVAAECQTNQHSIDWSEFPYASEEIIEGNFCSYAGALDTGNDHHLFYWFFKNENETAFFTDSMKSSGKRLYNLKSLL